MTLTELQLISRGKSSFVQSMYLPVIVLYTLHAGRNRGQNSLHFVFVHFFTFIELPSPRSRRLYLQTFIEGHKLVKFTTQSKLR